ncbi:MAG: DUF1345 domain-containing protein [Steroidobacteraceae bacterium]
MSGFFLQHARLLIAVAVGAAGYLIAPHAWSGLTRILCGWNLSVVLFLALTFAALTRMDGERLRSRYAGEDPTAAAILLVVTVAALLSLVAIVELLTTTGNAVPLARLAHVSLGAVTVFDSWLLVPTMFTLHYADMYYSEPADAVPLAFPRTPQPAFWDFVYFSFTIAAACQTADVATRNVSIRKVVIAHTIVSFIFNVSILGFAINVTAGLLGSG